MARHNFWLAETFSTTSLQPPEQNLMKLDRKQDLYVLYQICAFWDDRKNKIVAMASD